MPAPREVVQAFLALSEENKIICHRVNQLGPYFEYSGFMITLDEVEEEFNAGKPEQQE